MSLPPRPEYEGDCQRLLLAFDIGTTFSGISYSVLNPGKVPEIRPVTRYPSQERVGGDSKIPTVIYYDATGNVCAVGAETLREGIEEDAEDNDWAKAYWFKLHLRPNSKATMADRDEIPPLPPNKTVVRVFADYMRYLNNCAKIYISETDPTVSWESLEDKILYVLTHPNGWEGPQQSAMRSAAVLAGLIPNTTEGRSRITFVTEGKASLHFCLSNRLKVSSTENDNPGVVIVDAGGGTIDVTGYRKLSDHSFEEISIPKCYFQGSVYVTARAEKHFNDILSGTRFQQDVPILTRRFDRKTKHVFRKDDETQFIQFASHREHDAALNIRAGKLAVPGRTVASFFDPSVSSIIEAVKLQKRIAHFPIKTVFLVGGFSASDWLFEKVRDAIQPLGIGVFRPDSHINKAVSDGAVSFFLDGAVKSRVSRRSYGTRCWESYDPSDPSHQRRSDFVETHWVTGEEVLYGAFSVILPKNTRVTERKEYRQSYTLSLLDPDGFNGMRETEIFSYRGDSSNPRWIAEEPDQYHVECKVKADISQVKRQQRISTDNSKQLGVCVYYQITYDIVLLFGLTELQAQIAYKENGVEKRGPATVIYEDGDDVTVSNFVRNSTFN